LKRPQEYKTMIRLFLGISRSSDEELGFDLSMVAIPRDGGETQYEIRVGEKTYVTTRVLSNHAASAITGRGTRVWEAYDKADPDGPRVALKDVWMDVDSPSEGQILQNILAEMETFILANPDTEDPNYRKYFLTKLVDSYVFLRNDETDDTRTAMRNQTIPEPLNGFWTHHGGTSGGVTSHHSTASTSRKSRPVDENIIPTPLVEKIEPTLSRPRHLKHYRIVFEEVGEAVHKLPSMKEVLAVLRDAAIG
jgi:hypothetical protein